MRAVSADEIIARLPEGYESDVGEGGNSLSTGEKQLLSFARALLADPRIFVLDEATSSVDTVTERLIQNAIEKVMAGRTSFIIAHRLSTIRRADVILVVHGGRIVESGSHRELMAAKGAIIGSSTRGSTAKNRRAASWKRDVNSVNKTKPRLACAARGLLCGICANGVRRGAYRGNGSPSSECSG